VNLKKRSVLSAKSVFGVRCSSPIERVFLTFLMRAHHSSLSTQILQKLCFLKQCGTKFDFNSLFIYRNEDLLSIVRAVLFHQFVLQSIFNLLLCPKGLRKSHGSAKVAFLTLNTTNFDNHLSKSYVSMLNQSC
jgi:hypothetical protein